jgi:hypothetical protein
MEHPVSLRPAFMFAVAGLLVVSLVTPWPLSLAGWVSLVVVVVVWFRYSPRR